MQPNLSHALNFFSLANIENSFLKGRYKGQNVFSQMPENSMLLRHWMQRNIAPSKKSLWWDSCFIA